jgi:hypothetical protein
MSNVIDFLERMGQEANLRYADKRALELVLTQMQVAPDHQATILLKDQAQLEDLLGAQKNICCTIEPFDEQDCGMQHDKPAL